MCDVIQLRRIAVYKYASMNIYVATICSLIRIVFILLNIYGDKEQSVIKTSSNVTYFIGQNNSNIGYFVSAELM
jgi:hypothetical protein